MWRVFHERKVGVPPDLHEVYVKHLEVNWHKSEVDQLKNRPYFRVGKHGWTELLFQLILGALKVFPFHLAYKDVEARDGSDGEDGLGEE